MSATKIENILESELEGSILVNARAKLTFLQDEKERLETAISELKDNNELLRRINKELVEQESGSKEQL